MFVGVGRVVGEECFDLLAGRRQTGKIQTNTPQQRASDRHDSLALKPDSAAPRGDEVINGRLGLGLIAGDRGDESAQRMPNAVGTRHLHRTHFESLLFARQRAAFEIPPAASSDQDHPIRSARSIRWHRLSMVRPHWRVHRQCRAEGRPVALVHQVHDRRSSDPKASDERRRLKSGGRSGILAMARKRHDRDRAEPGDKNREARSNCHGCVDWLGGREGGRA